MRIPLTELPRDGMHPVRLPSGAHVVVIVRDGRVFVLDDECPHQALPLSAGRLCSDGSVECPFHGARFDLATGACRRGPATDAVATWETHIDETTLQILGKRAAT